MRGTCVGGLDLDVLISNRPPVEGVGGELAGLVPGSPCRGAAAAGLVGALLGEGSRDVLEACLCTPVYC